MTRKCIIVAFLITLLCCSILAAPQRRVLNLGKKQIELTVKDTTLAFVQTDDSTLLSTFSIKAKSNKGVHKNKISRLSHNRYVMPAEVIQNSNCYHSYIYEAPDGSPITILPRIAICVETNASIDQVLENCDCRMNLIQSDGNIYLFECDLQTSEEMLDLSNRVLLCSSVKWCEVDKFSNIRCSNPLFAQQYYLKNTGQHGSSSSLDINVEAAWDMCSGSPDITVAVVDGGVDLNHEDLSASIVEGYTVGSDDQGAAMSSSHGTACAGIIGAIDNDKGIKGIASGVKILPVNIFPYEPSIANPSGAASDIEIAQALLWTYPKADVISCSWGGQIYSPYIEHAISMASQYGRNGKGCIIVAAAGNFYNSYPDSVAYPARYSDVIAVGAINEYGNICSYSQRGGGLDLVAFGEKICTTAISGLGNSSTPNYLMAFDGTSAACPQVSGLAALMLSLSPQIPTSYIYSYLKQTAIDLGDEGVDGTYGHGLIDAYAAMDMVADFNFYKSYIKGPGVINENSYYFVDGLKPGMTVWWSVTGVASVTNNAPSANQCILKKVGTYTPSQVVLTARIYQNGNLVKTLTKTVTGTFKGTYWQDACNFYGVSHPSISEKDITAGIPVFVHQGCAVKIKSTSLINADVAYSGMTPLVFRRYSSDMYEFKLPYGSSGIPFHVRIKGDGNNLDGQLTFFTITNNGNINQNDNIECWQDDDGVLIKLITNNSPTEKALQYYESVEIIESELVNDRDAWDVSVTDVVLAKEVYHDYMSGDTAFIPTSGWPPGIYSVCISRPNEQYNSKFVIRK